MKNTANTTQETALCAIAGLQKMTLLDYPGKVACTVFLQGCNLRCPFCHNAELIDGSGTPALTQDELLAFLQKRTGLLEGVCITGGEPTLQPGLSELLRQIKHMGYAVKLDTNGMQPSVLKALVAEGLVDYVAMDIKNSPEKYAQTAGLSDIALSKIEESMVFLMEGTVDYEFRTTLVHPLHTKEDLLAMGQWFSKLSQEKPKKYFLQPFVDRDTVVFSGLSAPEDTLLQQFKEIMTPFVHSIKIRGQE